MAIFESIITGFIANLVYDKYKSLAVHTSDKYLNYSPSYHLENYSQVHTIQRSIPYKEEINFLNSSKRVELEVLDEDFFVSTTDNEWHEISIEGYQSLKDCGRVRGNEAAVRLTEVNESDDKIILKIQKTYYHEQAKSNLILDYVSDRHNTTLRKDLLKMYPGILPPLNHKSLANNMGLAIIVFYQDNGKTWIPYMVRRKKETGVFPGGLHCTASGVAKWPKEENKKDVFNYFTDHMIDELDEEVGLLENDIYDLKLIALCREFSRGGKPQLFYAAKTSLSLNELRTRRKSAKKILEMGGIPQEIDDKWYLPTVIKAPEELLPDFRKYKITLEGIASLYYGVSYLST